MALTLYYLLLGIYGIALVVSLVYYLRHRAPGGDASVGWALGIFYTAGLAAVIVIALLLRTHPGIGLVVLSFPLAFLAWPRIRRNWTDFNTRIPAVEEAPPLTLFLENHLPSKLHIKVECWFGKPGNHAASLYYTFDYYLEPLENSTNLLTVHETRLLAHKSKFVTVMIYERVEEEYKGQRYIREIQPCMQFFNEPPEAFRSGKYTVVVAAKP